MGQKVSNLIGIAGINLTQEMKKFIGIAIIGVMFVILGIAALGIL